MNEKDGSDQDHESVNSDGKPRIGKKIFDFVRGREPGKSLLLLGVLYTLYLARSLVLPIFIALLFAALLQPLVNRLHRLKIPDAVGAAIVVLVCLSIVAGGIYYLASPASTWLNRAPAVLGQAQAKVNALKKPLQKAQEATERLGKMTELGGEQEGKIVIKGESVTKQLVGGASSFLTHVVVVVILVYFLLAQGRAVLGSITSTLPDHEQAARFGSFLVQLQTNISAYLGTYAIINLGIALIVSLIMLVLGVPNPLLWGVVAGCFNFIPYLGPAATFGIISLVSLLSFDTLGRIVLPPLAYIALTTLEGNFITPTIMGNRLEMNPLIVFISILFWGWVWGVPGIFLAVPILVGLKILFSSDLTAATSVNDGSRDSSG